MLRTSYRAASERDFKAVTKGRGSLGRNLLVIAPLMTAVLFTLAYAFSHSVPVAGLVAGGILAASIASNLRFFRELTRRRQMVGNPHAVEVTEVTATRIMDIEPLGSHGPAFCFFVGDGKALLLVGQWLNECRSFPANSFLLHRWADTKKIIRIETSGQRNAAETITIRLRPTYRVKDIELFDATPETLQSDLDRAFDRPARPRPGQRQARPADQSPRSS